MTPEEEKAIVLEINSSVSTLNGALSKAFDGGLRLEVKVITQSFLAKREELPIVTVTVLRYIQA